MYVHDDSGSGSLSVVVINQPFQSIPPTCGQASSSRFVERGLYCVSVKTRQTSKGTGNSNNLHIALAIGPYCATYVSENKGFMVQL